MLVAVVCIVIIENLLKSISPINHYASFYHTLNHLLTKCIHNKVFIAFGFILLHLSLALSMLLCSFVHNLSVLFYWTMRYSPFKISTFHMSLKIYFLMHQIHIQAWFSWCVLHHTMFIAEYIFYIWK